MYFARRRWIYTFGVTQYVFHSVLFSFRLGRGFRLKQNTAKQNKPKQKEYMLQSPKSLKHIEILVFPTAVQVTRNFKEGELVLH